MDWQILLLVWIVGIPAGLIALSELRYRRRERARRGIVRRSGSAAPVIRMVPRSHSAARVRPAATSARRAAAGRRR